jgi:hypothetical protein
LGDPSTFFSKAPFLPARPVGAPIIGSTNRTLVLVSERVDAPDMPNVVLDREGWGPEGPIEGVDITRPMCRCKFSSNSQLGQGCSRPSAGGSGSAEFGAGDGGAAGDSNIGTIAIVGAVGIGALFLFGVL